MVHHRRVWRFAFRFNPRKRRNGEWADRIIPEAIVSLVSLVSLVQLVSNKDGFDFKSKPFPLGANAPAQKYEAAPRQPMKPIKPSSKLKENA
jgi:hypothetical protein